LRQQTDLEIYVNCEMARLIAWLNGVAGPLEKTESLGETIIYSSSVGPIVVTPATEEEPFTSVWLNTPASLWTTDVDFGRQAARELRCVVRCDPGQHDPEVHPLSDVFLEIDGDGERLIYWA